MATYGKTYAQKSSAVRAAKKQFGDDFAEQCQIKEIEGGFVIVTEEVKAFEPAPTSAIPALPAALTAPVIEEPAPATPILPAFLQEAPQAPAEVPKDMDGSILNIEPDDQPSNEDRAVAEELEYAAQQLAAADAQANATAVNDVSPLRPRISTTDKPTKKVWAIADSMPGKKRKEVIEACVAAGIAYGTARTQYQHWFKCVADQKVAPLAVIGADGAITIINQGDAGK